MALVDFDFLQDAVGLARRVSGLPSPLGSPSRVLKLWFNNFLPGARLSSLEWLPTPSFAMDMSTPVLGS
eukprot:1400769-Amphidinium_carterae.1